MKIIRARSSKSVSLRCKVCELDGSRELPALGAPVSPMRDRLRTCSFTNLSSRRTYMLFALERPGSRAALAIFATFGIATMLLVGCHGTDGGMVGTKGLWIANGTNVLEYVPSHLGTGTE